METVFIVKSEANTFGKMSWRVQTKESPSGFTLSTLVEWTDSLCHFSLRFSTWGCLPVMHTLSTLPPLPAMATPILPCSWQGLKAGGEDGPSGTAERISPAEGHRAGIVRKRHGGTGGSSGPMDMDMNMEGWRGAWSLELCGGSYSGQGPNKPCLHFLVPLSECPSSQGRDIALVLVVLWRPPPYYVDFYQPSLKGLAMCPDLIQTRSFPLFPSFYH